MDEPQLKIKQIPEHVEDATVIEGVPAAKKTKQPSYDKTCEVCNEPFTSKRQHSRTCSTSCRSKLSKKNKALGNNTDMNTIAEPQPSQAQKPKEFKKEKKSILPSPHITGLPPHLQMAFDLLKENARRFEDWYEKELAKREALEKQVDDLQDQLRQKQTTLQGLEDQQPTMFERILGSIPQPFIEAAAPHIGALMGKLSGGMQGTNGQLDEASAGLLQWIESLPPSSNQNLMMVFGTLMQLPDAQRDNALASVVKLLTEGSTMQKQRPINVGMFGT